jgi:hypothetical protein
MAASAFAAESAVAAGFDELHSAGEGTAAAEAMEYAVDVGSVSAGAATELCAPATVQASAPKMIREVGTRFRREGRVMVSWTFLAAKSWFDKKTTSL